MQDRPQNPKQGRVKLKDIAERTGLAVSTVSVVLNGHRTMGHISNTTRQEVFAAAQELGYEPPRRVRRQRLYQIGVFSNPGDVFWPALGEVCHVLNGQGYRPLVQTGLFPELRGFAAQLYERFEIDGAIFIGSPNRPEDMPPAELPSVVLGTLPQGATGNSVAIDEVAAGRLAGEHLWELGHRVVGALGTVTTSDTPTERRVSGLREAWQQQGAPASAVCVAPHPPLDIWTHDQWEDEFVSRLEDVLKASPDQRITALFCVSDAWAFATIRVLHRMGVRVPEDLSVVGVDDVAMAKSYNPALTTVRLDFGLLGAAAAKLLLRLLQPPADTAPVTEVQEPRLIVRESTGPPPGSA